MATGRKRTHSVQTISDERELPGVSLQAVSAEAGCSVIPDHRPVIGSDLELLRKRNGKTVSDMLYAFAMPPTRWYLYKNKLRDRPINKVTIALLARYYDQHPDELPTSTPPYTPRQMSKMVGGPMKRLAVLLGNEAAASFRWLGGSQGVKVGAMSPIAQRLAIYLSNEIQRGNIIR